jgi:nitric oxide reductase large subunit
MMKHALPLLLAALAGCSKSKMATFSGSTVGATGGALVGGAGGAAAGSVVGYGAGVVYDWATTEENKQTVKDLNNLSNGDIAAIVADHMSEQNNGLGKFLADLKKILIVAAAGLAVYLSIPFFYARQCSKTVEKKLTRPPFPSEKSKKTGSIL